MIQYLQHTKLQSFTQIQKQIQTGVKVADNITDNNIIKVNAGKCGHTAPSILSIKRLSKDERKDAQNVTFTHFSIFI